MKKFTLFFSLLGFLWAFAPLNFLYAKDLNAKKTSITGPTDLPVSISRNSEERYGTDVYAEPIVEDPTNADESLVTAADDTIDADVDGLAADELASFDATNDNTDDSEVDLALKNPTSANFHLAYNKRVQAFIVMYTGRKREIFEKGLTRYSQYIPSMQAVFVANGLPKELAYLSIVESNLNPRAISRANAVGIWQFMRYTGKLYGLTSDLYYDERLNVEKATRAAAQHLRDLYNTFHNWELALAAYNSGAGNVRKAIKRNLRLHKPIDFWSLRLPRETMGYVPAFHAVSTILKEPDHYGFTDFERTPESLADKVATRQIQVPPAVSFDQIQMKLGIDKNLLSELNPEIRHYITPPGRNFALVVPNQQIDPELLSSLKSEKINLLVTHQVRRGETVYSIARRYHTTKAKIYDLNPRVRAHRLRPGMRLVVSVANSGGKTLTARE